MRMREFIAGVGSAAAWAPDRVPATAAAPPFPLAPLLLWRAPTPRRGLRCHVAEI